MALKEEARGSGEFGPGAGWPLDTAALRDAFERASVTREAADVFVRAMNGYHMDIMTKVATKNDLTVLGHELRAVLREEFARVNEEFGRMQDRLSSLDTRVAVLAERSENAEKRAVSLDAKLEARPWTAWKQTAATVGLLVGGFALLTAVSTALERLTG